MYFLNIYLLLPFLLKISCFNLEKFDIIFLNIIYYMIPNKLFLGKRNWSPKIG